MASTHPDYHVTEELTRIEIARRWAWVASAGCDFLLRANSYSAQTLTPRQLLTLRNSRQVARGERDPLDLQRPDGSWNLATLGTNWRRADGTLQDYETSDGYGTGFVIYALRTARVSADGPRLKRGIDWLKTHQRCQRANGCW